MPAANDLPLSDDEILELDGFLLAGADEQADRLTVDEAHGYLTGLVVGNAPISTDEWMEVVWGTPAFANPEQKQRMTSLLLRMREEIAATLRRGQSFEPLVAEVEEGGELMVAFEGWCFGFMLAVSNDEARWSELPQSARDALAPIADLALLHTEEGTTDLDDEDIKLLAALVPGSVVTLYDYWQKSMRH